MLSKMPRAKFQGTSKKQKANPKCQATNKSQNSSTRQGTNNKEQDLSRNYFKNPPFLYFVSCFLLVSWRLVLLTCTLLGTCLLEFSSASLSFASEVLEKTDTAVVVREHPKTGKPYVVITNQNQWVPGTPKGARHLLRLLRPDYRMLDPKQKNIPYEGPVSNRKKIYALAATLAAGGTAAGLAIPTTAAASAAGGGAGYAAAGSGVAAGTISTSLAASQPKPEEEYTREANSQLQETNAKQDVKNKPQDTNAKQGANNK